MSHTPEPWRKAVIANAIVADSDEGIEVDGATGDCAVEYYGGNLIGESISQGNADHIIACVNACAGINPKAVPDIFKALCQIMQIPHTISNPDTALHMMHQAAKEALALAQKENHAQKDS